MTIRQTKEQLVSIINNSGLAIDVIELILEGLLAEVHLASERAYAEAEKKAQETQETEKDGEADEPEEGDVC